MSEKTERTVGMNQLTVWIVATVLLALVAAWFLFRLFRYKRQIRSFTQELERRLGGDVNSPLQVDMFEKEIVALAVELNKHTREQKEMMLQMEREREKLKNVIAGISHDFRTPLTGAYGYLQMVKKSGELSEKNEEYLDIALAKTLYLKELSDEFFEVSALEANTKQIETGMVHFDKLLQECILEQYGWIQENGLVTEFSVPEQSICVQGNAYYLTRILENLFSNVRKYAKRYVSVTLSQEGTKVRLHISNDMGGESLCADKVFEPFYRGESRSKNGSGLGLYVVKCLATAMGYEVEAKVAEDRFEIEMRM